MAMNKNDSQGLDLIGLLGSATPIFSTFDPEGLHALASQLEWVQIPGGEMLLRQGDPGDSLYVVITGRFRVSVTGEDGEEAIVGEIGRGEVVGEMAVITGEPRSATVRAIRDSGLVKLSKEAFERIVPRNPKTAMLIARRLVERLKHQGRGKAVRTLSTVGVIAASREMRLEDFAARLASAFAKLGPTLHVSSALIRSQFGQDAEDAADEATGSRICAWLDQQERHYKYLIYEADSTNPLWTEFCARQSDRVLLVADSSGDPLVAAPESQALKRAAAHKELVLLHADRTKRPSGTARWVKALGATRHHHVGAQTAGDYERLSRLLTGRSVGLTLGGGGARGLAHIGVIRAVQEANIPIDMIGGTSMGAVISAQYALGYDLQAMVELNRKGWVKMDPLKDKTLPVVAMLSGRKLDRMLAMMFGDAQIEDLWIKYFCVAVNLTQAETVIQQSGPLQGAVRASAGIPAVAPALCDRGDLIVDGGVLNNLPADVMRQLSGGKVIAVDVSPQRDLAVDPSYRQMPSAWKVLGSRVNPFAQPVNVPNILAVMMRTLMLGSIRNSRQVRETVDLYMLPPIDEFGLFDWRHIDKIIDTGYQYGRKKLEEWLEHESKAGTAQA